MKTPMPMLLLPCIAALAACNSPPKEAIMRDPTLVPEPLPAAESPAPARRTDSPAEAEGRRTLSMAVVMTGPDRLLTVELRDGRSLVLREVVMGPRTYCGVQMADGTAGARYCGGYADVAAALPGRR